MPDKQKKLYTVHAPIMGGILNKPDELALGPFIIKKNNYINIKTGEDNPADNFVNFLNNTLALVTHDTEYSILFKVEAKSKEEAIKLSVPFFELFELVAQFLLRGLERVQIGVIHFSTYRLQPFSVTGDGDNDFSMTFKPQNVTCPIQFELLTKKEDCSSIWRLMEKMANGKCTKMESRVLNAIFWIGRAERESQLPNKYVEYVFAIETLLSFNPKGVIVTPSIAYQLSEFAAFIISEAITECDSLKQERIKIMKLFKKIYQNRSKVVHGSTQDITEEEIAEVRDAVISLVSSFIMNEKLSKMTSIEEVADWINNLKFAGISEDHVHC